MDNFFIGLTIIAAILSIAGIIAYYEAPNADEEGEDGEE